MQYNNNLLQIQIVLWIQKLLHNYNNTSSIGEIANNIMYMQKGRATSYYQLSYGPPLDIDCDTTHTF